MPEPVLDEAAIEAAMRHFYEPQLDVIAGFREPHRSKYVDDLRRATREGIAAYFAALDREALVRKVTAVIDANRKFALGHPSGRALWVRAEDEAYDILADLGLIPTEGGKTDAS